MNIKDSYIHNGTAVLKDVKVENSVLKKILAGKDANDAYLGWETVCDLTGIKPKAAGTADKVGHKLTFSGGVTGTWDGSAEKTVVIPTKSSWNYDDVYLKLTGNGTTNPLTGTIYIKDVNGIILNSTDKDLNIWEVYGASGTWTSQFGFNLQYLGTSSGNNNDLILWAHNQAGTHVESYRVKQDGTFIFKAAPKVGTNVMYHAGNLTIKTLMGTTAIGDSDEPVYWNGSSFVKASAYPTKASWNYDDRYLKLSGGTLTGVLHLLGSKYEDSANTGALDLANSDIYGVNSIKFADLAESAGEGLQWYRDATHIDSLWVNNGVIYFSPNRTWGGTVTNYTVLHSGNLTPKTITLSTTAQTYITSASTSYTIKMPNTDPYTSARTPKAHTHYATTYKDSRNETMTPTQGVAVNGIAIDFKTKANGVGVGSGMYCGLITFDPYSDVSGGYPMQIGFNTGADSTNTNEVYIRTAKDANTWNAWRTIIHDLNYTSYTVKKDGTGASGTWDINISGDAATATKLATSRTIWGQSFNGTGNVSGALMEVTDITASGNVNCSNLILPLGGKIHNGGNYGLYISDSAGDYGSAIYLTHDHGKNQTAFRIHSHYDSNLGGLTIGFSTTTQNYGASPINATYDDILHIRGNGNIGINTTSPLYKLHVAGDIYTTTGFKKKDSSDSYVLLGGGGHKLISDFSMTHDHPYLPLSGGTLTGNIEWQTDSHGIYLYRGCGIEKWSGYGPTLIAEGDNTDFWIRNGKDRDIRYLILHTGNYTSYTVKKDGTGATGTWGINITGNAKTATNAGYATSAGNADTVDNYHTMSAGSLFYKYEVTATIPASSVTGDFWYATITFKRSYIQELTRSMLDASYSNIQGQVYLNNYEYDGAWYAFTTNYNGCNIKGISYKRVNNPIYYIKLVKPKTYNHTLPDGKITVYSPYNCTITVSATAPSGVTFTNINCPGFTNLKANSAYSADSATTATYASNVGSSGTAGTNYVTASKVISACNWYDTMIGSDSDTVINRWSEIVAFVAGFKETPDLATFLNNNYLAKAGGTMTGPLKWANATALPQQTSPQYFLCIDAFDDGGTTRWTSKADTLKALTGLTSTAIGDSDEPVYWNGNKFVKAGVYPTKSSWNYDDRYLKLTGGKITGPVTFEMSNDRKIYINNSDNETYWSLISFQQKGTEYGTLGTAGSTDLQWNGHNLYHAGNLTASVIGSLGTLSNNISGNAATATKATQDGNGNVITNTYLHLSGGTLTGTLGKSNNYIFKPNGGDFRTRTEIYNGAICISLPANIGNTMLSMWIDVYNYSTNKSFSVHVGGYTYNNSNFSNSPFAMVYGASHKVRLTYDNGFKIYIGETNSIWNYPQISIRDVILGFGHNYSNWYNDWSISFVTSFPTINKEITRYAITTDNINNQSVNYANSAGSVAWVNVTGKPATATRWPSWSEVTNKPSTFPVSEHNHDGRYLRWNGSAADVSAMAWGTLTAANGYTILSHAASSDGGDWGMVNKGGKIYMQLDGYYYQNEGQYRVTDVSETVTALGTNGNYLTWTKNGTTNNITIPYATKAGSANSATGSEYLNNYSITNPNSDAIKDNKVKWFAQINSSSGYAGNNYGFPAINNANGILYLGTHPGKYGHQLGFSSNGNIYHRYQNGSDFPNTANGGSWEILLTSNNYTTYTVKKDGTGASGTWGISITGSAKYLASNASKNIGGLSYYYIGGSTFNTTVDGSWSGYSAATNYNSIVRLQSHTGSAKYYIDLIFDVNNSEIYYRRVTNNSLANIRKIDAYEVPESTASYSLSNAAWTNTITLPTTAGSYILNIVSGNSTLTGVFSIGASDNAKDEISLHLHGNGPRLYARTNGTTLQLSSNDASATSRSVTIKYRRMI